MRVIGQVSGVDGLKYVHRRGIKVVTSKLDWKSEIALVLIPSHLLMNGDGVIGIKTHVQTIANTNFSAISPRK